MELRHIESFVLLARHASFSRTAVAMGVAQPALSQRIKQLEDELGVQLVDRTTRPLRLTAAGRTFLPRAERVLAEAETAAAEMRALAGLAGGTVTVGALPALAELWLPPIVARFHLRHPQVSIRIREEGTEELARLVAVGELDLAVLHEVPDLYPGDGRYPGLAAEHLFEEELMVVAAAGHPLAARRAVAMDDLRDEAWVLRLGSSGLAHTLSAAMARAGFEPRVVARCSTQVTVRAVVAAGVGISVLPRLAATDPALGLVAIRLRPPLPAHTTVVAWRADAGLVRAAEELVGVMRTEVGPPPSRRRRRREAATGVAAVAT